MYYHKTKSTATLNANSVDKLFIRKAGA